MRGVPVTRGVRLCGPEAGELGCRPEHNGTSSVIVRGVSAELDSREPTERGGKPGVDAERGLTVWRVGGWRGQPGAPLSGPGPAAMRRLGGEGGLGGKDEAGETAAASSRPRAEGTGEGQAPRGPSRPSTTGFRADPACMPIYLLHSA